MIGERLARLFGRRATTLRCSLAALVAWALTVAPIASVAEATMGQRLIAALTLLAGTVGPLLGPGWGLHARSVVRHVGLSAFVALALLSWVLAAARDMMSVVDDFRSVLGAAAWALFTLSWLHPWSVPEHLLDRAPAAEAKRLVPRRRVPRYLVGVGFLGLLAALGCLGLAWRIAEPSRAVLAQALAVGAAIALLSAASAIVVALGKAPDRLARVSSRRLSRTSLNSFMLVLLVLTVALVLHLTGQRN